MPVQPILITAPPTERIKFDLLDTVTPKALPAHGGMAGVSYDTDFCGVARPWVNPCVDPGVAEKIADDGIEQTVGEPIPIYHLFSCRLVGSSEREARAERSLELGASRAVEEGFAGVIAAQVTADTADLTPGGTPVGVIEGVALAEQYAGANYGGRAVLHMDRATASVAISQGLVKVVGDHLETLLGSLVIAGAGYAAETGPSAPAAGAHWMYITGAVNIWEGKVQTSDTVLEGHPYTNEFYVLAERVYVPTFECFAAAVEILLEA